jgi:hypothetical protein
MADRHYSSPCQGRVMPVLSLNPHFSPVGPPSENLARGRQVMNPPPVVRLPYYLAGILYIGLTDTPRPLPGGHGHVNYPTTDAWT